MATPLALRADPELTEAAKQRDHRDRVQVMEDEILKHAQYPIEITHYFADGIYGREAVLPKGAWATGRIHKFSQINIITNGDITVFMPDGPVRYRGSFTFVTPAGTKRLAYAHEDTKWITLFGTHETDVDTIVDKLTVGSEEEYAAHLELTRGKVLEIK